MSTVPSVYVCSIDFFSGKSTLCLGLALRLREEGYRVGYFKPVGWEMARGPRGEVIDEDAHLMRSALGLDLPLDTVVPVVFNSRFLEEGSKTRPDHYEKRLMSAYEEASRGMDLMVLEGPTTLGIGAFAGIDPASIAKKLESQILLVSRVESDVEIDQIIREYRSVQAAGVNLLGAVLNIVPKPAVERIRWFALPILRKHQVNILGIVPENPLLRAPSVGEILEKVGGTVLACEDKLDRPVEDFLVGAMTPETALTYFRRSVNKAVITGGDRPDIQLAALQTSMSALILTGNLYPDVRVLARAEELGVPVLMVPYDTYTTVMRIARVTGRIKPTDTEKIGLAKRLVEDYLDWRAILKALLK